MALSAFEVDQHCATAASEIEEDSLFKAIDAFVSDSAGCDLDFLEKNFNEQWDDELSLSVSPKNDHNYSQKTRANMDNPTEAILGDSDPFLSGESEPSRPHSLGGIIDLSFLEEPVAEASMDKDDVITYSDDEEEPEEMDSMDVVEPIPSPYPVTQTTPKSISATPKSVRSTPKYSNVIVVKAGPKPQIDGTKRKRRKPKANAWSQQVRPQVVAKAGSRPRLYEQKPFEDPELERCRQNALFAKMNRDRKRKEKEDIQKSLETLRRENERLKKKEAAAAERATQAEERLARLEAILRRSRLEGLVAAVTCDVKHSTARARANWKVCSQGKA